MAASVVHNILKEPAVLKGWSHYRGKNIPKPEDSGPNPVDTASTLDIPPLCHGKKKQIFEIIFKLTCFVICLDLSHHGYSYLNLKLGLNILPFHFNSPYPIHVHRYYCIFHAITRGLSVDFSVFEAAVGNMAVQVMC